MYSKYNREFHSLFIFFITIIFIILVQRELKKYHSVKGKLKPLDNHKLRIADNKYLDFGLCVDNLSNQVIETVVDIQKSFFIVNGITIAKEKLEGFKNTLYPFATHAIWVQVIDIDQLNIHQPTFNLSGEMYLKYGEYSQQSSSLIKCKLEAEFSIDKTNNKQILKDVRVNILKIS